MRERKKQRERVIERNLGISIIKMYSNFSYFFSTGHINYRLEIMAMMPFLGVSSCIISIFGITFYYDYYYCVNTASLTIFISSIVHSCNYLPNSLVFI